EEGSPPPALDPDETVLISGGTSGLGALIARHLVAEHGIRHLLLLSRRGAAAEGAAELEADLAQLGAEGRIEACDIAEREQLAQLIDSISAEHPLGAVVHSAGVIEGGTVGETTAEGIAKMFAPKVDGAWHLHELTESLDLSAFVLFS